MNGRRNQSAAPYKKILPLGVVHRHDDGLAQQASEVGVFAGLFPGTGMSRVAVVFLLITPMAISSAMMPDKVSAVVSPGMATMSSPTEQTLVMASSFSMESCPLRAASEIFKSSLTGMKAPLKPPTLELAKAPPFLTASFSNAKAAVLPGTPMARQSQTLKDLAHAVAHIGRGRQGKIHHAKGNAQAFGHIPADQFARPGDLIRRALDQFGNLPQIEMRDFPPGRGRWLF